MKKPLHQVKFGRVKAQVWENESANGPFLSVTLGKLYKNQAGEWRTSQSFGRYDLTPAIQALEEATRWIEESLANAKAP